MGTEHQPSSDEDSDFEMSANECGDAESNVSVYGSTSSNEGDTLDEFEEDSLEHEEGNCNADALPLMDNEEGRQNQEDIELQGDLINNSEEIVPIKHAGHNLPLCEKDFGNGSNLAAQNSCVVKDNGSHLYVKRKDELLKNHTSRQSCHLLNKYNMPSNEADILNAHIRDQNGGVSEILPGQSHYYFFSQSNLVASDTEYGSSECKSERSTAVENLCSREFKRMKADSPLSLNMDTEVIIPGEDTDVPEFVPQENYSNMDSLPDDLVLEIFSKLNVNSLINIAPVCKRWYELSKHKSLWAREDIIYDPYHVHQFLRYLRAAKYLRTVDVSGMHATHGKILLTLLNGPENVRRFSCFCVAHPRVIVELLQRYQYTLEELNISISDERLSYGDGGTFKDGVKPRPGYLLQLISEMKNLRVIRFAGTVPSIGQHQGRVNPKWYFGELESPGLKLYAISMKFENPREILVDKFIIPFLKSKVSHLKELHLTNDIWKYKDVQDVIRSCDKLEAIVRFPIEILRALQNCKQQVLIDFIVGSWIDFHKIQRLLINFNGLSHIQEVSLRFCDMLYPKLDEHLTDTRLQVFLPLLADRLHSCKRVHIYRWDAASPFVESVHSTRALSKFLSVLSSTLEEVHISDAFCGGRYYPQIMKVIRDSVPHLKSRGIAMNRLGNRGLLFSVHKRADSVILNSSPLLLEYGRSELRPF